MRGNLTRLVFVLFLTVVAAPWLRGQTAEVTGTVTDQSGSRIPAATVSSTNVETGVVRQASTNAEGNYLIQTLLPGRYLVSVEADGFKVSRRSEVVLAVDQVARIDFSMEIGAVQETVTVEGSAVLLETATSSMGTVVENRQVTQLPLSGRNPLDLVALSGGVRIQGGFGGKTNSTANLGNFTVNGGVANANAFLVEGLPLDLASMNGVA